MANNSYDDRTMMLTEASDLILSIFQSVLSSYHLMALKIAKGISRVIRCT